MNVDLNDRRARMVAEARVMDVLAEGGRYLLFGTPYVDPIVVRWPDRAVSIHANAFIDEHAAKVQAAIDEDNAKHQSGPFLF